MAFVTTALSVLSLMLLVVPGFALIKTKMLNPTHIAPLVTILLFVAQPMIIFDGFLSKTFEPSMLANMGIALLAGALTQAAIALLSKLIFSYDKEKARANAFACSSAFGNLGFMGIPVLNVVLPGNAEALVYLTMYLITFNILSWTLGVYILTGDKKFISLKKAFLNPPMLALVIVLPLFFLKVDVPDVIMTPVRLLSGINTPLAMIVLGMRLATLKFSAIFKGFGVYLTSFIKLLASPLLLYAALYFMPMDDTVFKVLILLTAMPTANSVLMFAERYDGDISAASKSIMMTTIFSIVTIPLLMLLPM